MHHIEAQDQDIHANSVVKKSIIHDVLVEFMKTAATLTNWLYVIAY